LLSEVLASKQTEQRFRRILQAIRNVLLVHEVAVSLPAGKRVDGLGNSRGIIKPGEALHARTPSHQIGVVRWAGLRRGGVGFRDRAAQYDARVEVDPSEDLVEDLAADIVEEHVDPVGAKLRKPSAEVFALVVDGCVEVRLVDQPSAFILAARGADDAAALDLGDLAGDGAPWPRRRPIPRRSHQP
jgi:hypothetical protein